MKKNDFREFMHEVAETIKTSIIELASTELDNSGKKQILDNYIFAYLETCAKNYNFLIAFLIKKLLLPNLSEFTQIIFNLLKANLQELNRKKEG